MATPLSALSLLPLPLRRNKCVRWKAFSAVNVAFLIYNRPQLTRRVLDAVAEACPARLLVVADGPKDQADRKKCEAARSVLDGVDWDCEVETDFARENMGCRRRVSSGLDWVFSRVEDAVILEDDCLPHATFFPFCAELLDRYRHDDRVAHIAGTNLDAGNASMAHSYFFSRFTTAWGWATWRRCWQDYDVDLRAWPAVKATGSYCDLCSSRHEACCLEDLWDDFHAGRIDSWDAQWAFNVMTQNRVAIVPSVNMVSNLGFGPGATHTHDAASSHSLVPACAMEFPLRHPPHMICNAVYDRAAMRRFISAEPFTLRYVTRRLRNKHFYGAMVRSLPWIGPMWENHRRRVG